jgi:two-component system CheB/CheR fusion protein
MPKEVSLPAPPPRSALAAPPILAIGASAGGLVAFRKLLEVLPADGGFATLLVQHLDPDHESLLADLLTPHTQLAVQTAADGDRVEAGHLYIIPPGAALAVHAGVLRLTPPAERHGARLPFDFLLRSLAEGDEAESAMAVVLSGSGEDGKEGALALRARGGFVVAQDPEEAEFAGMPAAAIAAGAVDAVLPIAAIPEALLRHLREAPAVPDQQLARIVALLRARTEHDFSPYKPGTLQRRIERRIGLLGCADTAAYAARLAADPAEQAQLVKDLLIHVTGFFRDPEVFEALAASTIPGLVAAHLPAHPLRVWVVACSTGEEAWSLAMLFHEAIAADGRGIRLQVFASDKDADSVAQARQGCYPASVTQDISVERLANFFVREEAGFRVTAELRAQVVFSVQNAITDPPFSRLDFVSCRNLLIYLRPEAQARLIALFRFALRPGGLLLLGLAETVAESLGFEVVTEGQRLWRREGRVPPAEPGLLTGGAAGVRPAPLQVMALRDARRAELFRRAVLQHHAPACVLVDRSGKCLHALGPVERQLVYIRGPATQDIVALARPALRARLRAALEEARGKASEVVRDATAGPVIEVRPFTEEGETMFLVCFLDAAEPAPRAQGVPAISTGGALERELEVTRAELRGAIRELEAAAEDQRAAKEEALSVNEEYQSTNEELLTSKEELQSLNEELTVLNGQLQETLEASRTATDDLQNVLYSTEVATLFLDRQLRIRFFTPATRAVFGVMPGDVGRPLSDLRPLTADPLLFEDAAAAARGDTPPPREVEGPGAVWFSRRAQPYRAQGGAAEGVVVTYNDITARRAASEALEEATRRAEEANAAKSRFVGAASHDLRQPLQSLTLLQNLLSRAVEGEEAGRLVALLAPTLASMAGILDGMLDLNQIEAGALVPRPADIAVGPLLSGLAVEFGHLAAARGLALRSVPCGLFVRSDPRLLEQILRNLLSNALKYTHEGRVLLGCRRRGGELSIEVWDTGIGIPAADLPLVFEEYRQLDNAARERTKGLGLGLAIVHRLAELLGHPLRVRSEPGRGSVFSLDVTLAAAQQPLEEAPVPAPSRRSAGILVVEDDAEIRDLLGVLLRAEGYEVWAAADGAEALAWVGPGGVQPDLLLTDQALPGGLDGPSLAVELRGQLGERLPVILLTANMADVLDAPAPWTRLRKPVGPAELVAAVRGLLEAVPVARAVRPVIEGGIHVVDDDPQVRDALRRVLGGGGPGGH